MLCSFISLGRIIYFDIDYELKIIDRSATNNTSNVNKFHNPIKQFKQLKNIPHMHTARL